MNLLRKIFGLHQHDWITRFRGQYTRGVECRVCDKTDLLEDVNDGSEPVGWLEDLDEQGQKHD